jgi:hypothetical protein
MESHQFQQLKELCTHNQKHNLIEKMFHLPADVPNGPSILNNLVFPSGP